MPFSKVKHIRLLHAFLCFIRMLLFPVAPLLIVIYDYKLYELIHVSKFQLVFIVLALVIIVQVIKYIYSTIRMDDAFSDGQYMTRFVVKGILESVKWIFIFIGLWIISKDIGTVDLNTIESIQMFLGSILVFIGCKLLEIWFNTLLIKPAEFVMENRHLAYRKAKIEDQSNFVK